MKKLLLIVLTLFALDLHAQIIAKDTTIAGPSFIDSSKIMAPFTMKTENHLLVIDMLEKMADVDWAPYYGQVAKALDTASLKPTQPITVRIESGKILELFARISASQERFSASLNSDLRTSVVPQLTSYTWLYREVLSLNSQNNELLRQRKVRAFNFLKRWK